MNGGLEPGDELLSLATCEKLTERKVSTWRADIRARRIPAVHLGRLVRIRRSDLSAFIASGFRPAVTSDREVQLRSQRRAAEKAIEGEFDRKASLRIDQLLVDEETDDGR